MRIRMAPVLVAGLGMLLATGVSYAQVQPCTEGCIEVSVSSPEGTFGNGQEFTTTVSFAQGPADKSLENQAAIAFTLGLPSLLLADCDNPTEDGLTAAISVPENVADNFRVVVENTTCSDGKPCLCPGEGETLAQYINVVVFGPKDLPTPGSGPVDFPLLPNGPLLSLNLRVSSPLTNPLVMHLYNEADNQGTTPKPQFGAFLSVGDTDAVDDTVDRTAQVSNVRVTDGLVQVTPIASNCVGDCNLNCVVTIGELQQGLNMFFGISPALPCFDANGNGVVTIGELQQGLNNFFNGCPQPCEPQ